jgi:hypothetical protein
MTRSSKQTAITEYQVRMWLRETRQVAIHWGIEDVQNVRPDLNADQAYDVLLECERKHDANWGLTWTFLKDIADELFPARKESRSQQGGRV